MRRLIITLILLLTFSLFVTAQEEPVEEALPEIVPEDVMTRGEDQLRLRADFYLVNPDRPTVILLHQLYTTRASWADVIPVLVGNGYNVLVPDIRGYGATRGALNWGKAVNDVGAWFTFLRTEVGVRGDAISTMGSSMGSTLAIVGCANDEFCRTSIALSPGWDYYNISLADSIAVKPTFVIYAERDRYPALGIDKMREAAPDNMQVHIYEGNAHGMNMLRAEFETAMPLMMEWLAAHGG